MPDEPVAIRTDPVVDRVNELTTTALDTLAVLLMAGSVGWLGWGLSPSAGLGFAAILLILFSSLAQARHRNSMKRKAEVPARPHREVVLPGPEDPGNLHVKGR